MRIDIRFRGLEGTDTLREYAEKRAQAQLCRFDHAVDDVVMRLSDLNGPKGGVDKRCHVMVRSGLLGTTTIEEVSGDEHTAIATALERAARTIGQRLARTRSQTGGLRRAS
jgi:hypothetical protein